MKLSTYFILSIRQLFFLIVFLWVFTFIAFAQAVPDLVLNQPIEREIKGGETQSFRVESKIGQLIEYEITQHNTLLTLTIKSSDGKDVAALDVKDDNQPITMSFIAKTDGSHTFLLTSKSPNQISGQLKLVIVGIRTATEKDIIYANVRALDEDATELASNNKFNEAIAEYEKALVILKQYESEENETEANLYAKIGAISGRVSNIKKAEENDLKALAIFERLYGPKHLYVAKALANLGFVYLISTQLDKGETTYLRVIDIMEQQFGKDNLNLATPLNNLGSIYYKRGNYTKAAEIQTRALEIMKSKIGENDKRVASFYNNIALTYRAKGDYVKARQMLEQSLNILEKVSPQAKEIATIMGNIGAISAELRDNKSAESYFQKAAQLQESQLGKESPELASTLNRLASIYKEQGNYDKAESIYQNSLAIIQKAFGTEHIDYGVILDLIAEVKVFRGQYDEAEKFENQATEIFKKKIGAENSEIAESYRSLGIIAEAKKDFEKAEELYKKSLAIYEKVNGELYPKTIGTMRQLIVLYLKTGEKEKALVYQKRLLLLQEKLLELYLALGSERQKLNYIDGLNFDLENTFDLQKAINSEETKGLSLNLALQRKGRVLEFLTNNLNILRQNSAPDDQKLFDQLSDLRSQLANTVIKGSSDSKLEGYAKKLEDLNLAKEKLESQLSERIASYSSTKQAISLDLVQKSIPANTVLIEFIVDTPIDRTNNSPKLKYLPSHYVVYALNRQGEIESKDLGETKAIDDAIANFRLALEDTKRKDIKQVSQNLTEKIIAPLRQFLGNSTQLLISPDGQLNLIPFEALADNDNKYLVEKYSISYLSSGRDLLRMQHSKPNNNPPLIIANPNFGESKFASEPNLQVAKRAQKRSVTVAKSLAETYFSPLMGTELEGKTIQAFFPEANLLSGEKATENALKQAKSPKILHIATHGFFLEGEKETSENPLLRSGLALTGANVRTDSDNDGILTALEGSGSNLFGTKLVVLSACGTGLGEVKTGEGVFGLRRSFVLAGSESLIISLWSVSDFVTRDLMAGYYKGLQQGQGRGEALRQVQLQMMKRKGREHPFYWASFIQSGEWANLEGKR